MPLRMIDAKEGLTFIRPEDQGEESPVTFWYHPMTEGVARRIANKYPPQANPITQSITINEGAIRLEAFLSLVFKIENVRWAGSTETVTLTKREEMERFLNSVPPGSIDGLYSAIMVSGKLTEAEAKNSGGSPGSPA